MVTVQQLADVLGQWAPWDDAEQWDNVGVLAGRGCTGVGRVVHAGYHACRGA